MTKDNDLTGILFREDNPTNPAAPDYTGRVQINGTTYRLAGWLRTSSKTGRRFVSLKLEAPQQHEQEREWT